MEQRNPVATAVAAPAIQQVTGPASSVSQEAQVDPRRAQITVLYDAFGRDAALQKDWGYAAFIELNGKRVLFDTGNNPDVLARNAAARQVDLTKLDFVVMSHRHGDHMGGMPHLLCVNPEVLIYAPKEGFGVYGGDLPGTFYRRDDSLPLEQRYYDGQPPAVMRFGAAWPQARITLVDEPVEVAPGFHLISLVSERPGTLELRELSLAIETPEGMVLVVGCSHTGLDNILKASTAIRPGVRFLVGGFHFVVANDDEIEELITLLRDKYQVAAIAPGHCTGEPTFAALRRALGNRYHYAGLGSRLSLEDTERPNAGADRPDADDLHGYEVQRNQATLRNLRLFDRLGAAATTPEGAYLGRWHRTILGCC